MISLLPELVLAGGLLLVAGSATGMSWLRLRQRRRALQRRIDAVAEPNQRSRPVALGVITRRRVKEAQPLVRKVAGLFGYDPMFAEEGPRWYVVLPLALGLSFIASQLLGALLGDVRMLVLIPGWVFLSRWIWGWWRDRRLALLLAQFPDALAMIVRSVRVGIPVSESVRVVSQEAREPTARKFSELADEITIGVPLDEALQQMAARTGLQEYRFFATAISLQNQTGGALGETLDNLADVIRRRLALRARGRALSSEARTSILVLTVLPVLIGGALYLVKPDYMGVLFSDPTGRHLLGMAIISLCLGIVSMQLIIRRVLS